MADTAETTTASHDDPAASVSARSAFLARVGFGFVVAPSVVLAAVVSFVAAPVVGVATLVVAGVALAAVWRSLSSRPEQKLLALVASSPIDPVRHARLENLTDGLSLVSGTARPELRECEGSRPCALVVSGRDEPGVIVVSQGATSAWGRMETEAVVAHLLFRLRSGDAALTTSVLAVCDSLSRIGLSPLAHWVRRRTLDGSFVLSADVAACRMTRYPPGMVSALDALVAFDERHDNTGDALRVPAALAPLCFEWSAHDTTGAPGFPIVETFHPPLADRIALCKEI